MKKSYIGWDEVTEQLEGNNIAVRDVWFSRDEIKGYIFLDGDYLLDEHKKEILPETINLWKSEPTKRWVIISNSERQIDEAVLTEEVCTALFTKHDSGKLRYGLIPPLAEAEMVGVLTFGAQKYSVDNWRKCDDMSRYVDAALRHISAYRRGEFKDSETELHHLAHAMCCLSFIVDIEIGDGL